MTVKAEPDAAAAAAREIEARGGGSSDSPPTGRRVGRPRGSKTRKSHARKPGVAKEPVEISPEEVAAFAMLGGTLWSISARVFKMDDLTDDERTRLGAAMAPVAEKYLPIMGEYAPEITLVTLVAGLVVEKRKKKPAPVDDGVGPDLELVGGNGQGIREDE